jgi:hypothetical protein
MQLVDEPMLTDETQVGRRRPTSCRCVANATRRRIVNQYPQPSHSFIRREIRALEGLGYDVRRFSVRRWNGRLVDRNDLEENKRTTAILEQGLLAAAWSVVTAAVAPRRFLAALRQAWTWGRRSDRGRLLNLVYFVEACVLLRLLRRERIEHLHAHFGTT